MTLSHHLFTMAHHNAWANHRLLAACSQLTQAELVAARTSFFPSIRATLNHIVTVDWYYVTALEHWRRNAAPEQDARRYFDPPQPFERCAELSEAQHAVDRRLVALCRSLNDGELEQPVAISRRVGIQYETVTRTLSHLFEHQIHHRGQVHAMLAGTSVAPPQLDEFFCANEADLRATELAELGTSEAEIWNG